MQTNSASLKPEGCRGCIYAERTAAGAVNAPGRKKFRYVAEIYGKYKRIRFRSTNLKSVQHWLIKETKKINKKKAHAI